MTLIAPTDGYSSIDDILVRKYGIKNIASADFPDWRNKTIYLDKRGNDISGTVLSYAEADRIIEAGLYEPLP
ncbi:MAG: hypothetical protein KBB91_00765 [Candidatus Pacebacteria bacterium]|jgi:hypothetical protein|nr:hypothetical protein [Candidatus Paceibacterota bacterium]MBP9700938.1 hypothetical protein [Candidatus Paceibacterota bacterium]